MLKSAAIFSPPPVVAGNITESFWSKIMQKITQTMTQEEKIGTANFHIIRPVNVYHQDYTPFVFLTSSSEVQSCCLKLTASLLTKGTNWDLTRHFVGLSN